MKAKGNFKGRSAVLICLIWVAGFSCAVDPVTGKRELMLLSEADEVKLGQKTDRQVVARYGAYEDADLTAYAARLGQDLAARSHRPGLDYHFRVLDASVVNAFAVPGGYVYLTRGILASMNSDAELAGVLGHEIGHITARHSAEQYSRAQLAQVGLGLGVVVSEVVGLGGFSQLAQLGVGMLFLKFSRDNEREADDLGVEYAARAGYDAAQLAAFFETLERMNPGSDRTGLPGWFSTHPNPEDRVQVIQTRSRQWRERLGQGSPKADRESFLHRIDGLVYGEDPRQGYEENGVFYHPGLQFQFPIPPGWQVHNTPAAVQMTSEERDAIMLFSLSAAETPIGAARRFVRQSGARVVRSDARDVNGLPGHRLVAEARSRQGVLGVMSTFIQKGPQVYAFHGVTGAARFLRFRNVFETTMGGFMHLEDPEKIQVEPERIRLRRTEGAGTVRQGLQALGIPDHQIDTVAVLNGMKPDDPLPAGMLLKVIAKK